MTECFEILLLLRLIVHALFSMRNSIFVQVSSLVFIDFLKWKTALALAGNGLK